MTKENAYQIRKVALKFGQDKLAEDCRKSNFMDPSPNPEDVSSEFASLVEYDSDSPFSSKELGFDETGFFKFATDHSSCV